MIYCVRFADVIDHLAAIGFSEIARTDVAVVFEGAGRRRVALHPPNVRDHVPDALVNDAFGSAGLDPPPWDVFWCD